MQISVALVRVFVIVRVRMDGSVRMPMKVALVVRFVMRSVVDIVPVRVIGHHVASVPRVGLIMLAPDTNFALSAAASGAH